MGSLPIDAGAEPAPATCRIAQRRERLAVKEKVDGSSPSAALSAQKQKTVAPYK